MVTFTQIGTFYIFLISRVSGIVKDLPKPSFLSLEPPSYSKEVKKIRTRLSGLYIVTVRTLVIATCAKGACRKTIEIGFLSSSKL